MKFRLPFIGIVLDFCRFSMYQYVLNSLKKIAHDFVYHVFLTAFTPFRSCYYLLYQCLVPNPREGLSLLVQHCSVPDDFERSILSGGIPRLCNQGILNYLLIILRRDKDFVKFWNIMKLLIDKPELRIVVERIQKGYMTRACTHV